MPPSRPISRPALNWIRPRPTSPCSSRAWEPDKAITRADLESAPRSSNNAHDTRPTPGAGTRGWDHLAGKRPSGANT